MTRFTRFGLPLAAALLAILSWLFAPSGLPEPSFPGVPSSRPESSPASLSLSHAPWQAHLVRAADGDSFTVRRADTGQTVELRLYGVDAPENGQPYGQASRRNLLAMTEGKTLAVAPMESDQYGRWVAVVFAAGDETSVNERQLEQGMAWYYEHFCRAPFCADWKAKEQRARAERAGLWRDKQPENPREWRREHRHPR